MNELEAEQELKTLEEEEKQKGQKASSTAQPAPGGLDPMQALESAAS
jgi:hypothetical protein